MQLPNATILHGQQAWGTANGHQTSLEVASGEQNKNKKTDRGQIWPHRTSLLPSPPWLEESSNGEDLFSKTSLLKEHAPDLQLGGLLHHGEHPGSADDDHKPRLARGHGKLRQGNTPNIQLVLLYTREHRAPLSSRLLPAPPATEQIRDRAGLGKWTTLKGG